MGVRTLSRPDQTRVASTIRPSQLGRHGRANPTLSARDTFHLVIASATSLAGPTGLRPGGTELTRNVDQAQRLPLSIGSSNERTKRLVQCGLPYLSSSSSVFLVATNPCVWDTPEATLDT